MAQNSVKAIPLSSFNSASITGAYQSMNTSGLPHPCFLIRVMNASDELITVSYDGITNNDVVLSNSTLDVPMQANAQPNAQYALMSARTQIYIKGAAGTGNIYLSGYYV